MKNWLLLLLLLIVLACTKKENEGPTEVIYGKNTYHLNIDGIQREFIVHVPKKYDGTTSVPLVFMLHGTAQDGQEMYINSGWKDVGETENLITVYPSALSLCIIEDGVQKSPSKWNAQPSGGFTYCANVKPPNDLKFLEAIMTDLQTRYKINEKRIYVVGFSNGGQMAGRCAVDLSHKLAAVVESAVGLGQNDSTSIPKRKLPLIFQIGNDDHGVGNTGPELPLSKLEAAIKTPGFILNRSAKTHAQVFDLKSSFTISGDTNTVAIASFQPLSSAEKHEFHLLLVKDLKHAYPDGSNHWYKAAKTNWEWMKKFTLP